MANKYKTHPNGVIRLADYAFIPNDNLNRDWREYQEWLSAGNTPDSAQSKDEAKAVKWAAIKFERDLRISSSGVQVSGRWYDTDSESRSRYYALEISSRGQVDETVLINNWRPDDVDLAGSVELTRGLVVQIISAGIMQVAAIDAAAQAHKAALEASEDPASYDYSEGWPQSYAEWAAEQAAAAAEA